MKSDDGIGNPLVLNAMVRRAKVWGLPIGQVYRPRKTHTSDDQLRAGEIELRRGSWLKQQHANIGIVAEFNLKLQLREERVRRERYTSPKIQDQ